MTINLERRAFVQSGALLATGVALADAVAPDRPQRKSLPQRPQEQSL